jgi:hypothetical protein
MPQKRKTQTRSKKKTSGKRGLEKSPVRMERSNQVPDLKAVRSI